LTVDDPALREFTGTSVRLRAPRPGDYPILFPWYNDPEVVAPFDRFSLDTYESFVRSVESAPGDPASLAPRFVIERLSDGRPLGFVGYYAAHPVLTLTDVWYVLGAAAERGRGYGSEAVRLLIGHLFESTDLVRVGATTDVENLASVRLLERIGFRREGTLRYALFHHARWHDVFVYSVTRPDWVADRPPA
jgi:RimJ/RimL family protein N-acetyltransferase